MPAANRAETSRSELSRDKEPESGAPAPGGGFKAWLPLIANVVLMPVLAYVTITFVILPRGEAGQSSPALSRSASSGAQKDGGIKRKTTVPLGSKVLVNVAGTMGTRYLLANITLVSEDSDLRNLIDKHDAELRDAAAGTLSSKTISDLEKPGARNLIRTELISVFNNVLGQGTVTEIYLTEFAVQ